MRELFLQNKVAFIAVITIMIAVFLIYKAVKYIQKKGLEGIRLDVYDLFVEAEHVFTESKTGKQKFEYVIRLARSMLPKAAQVFITEDTLKAAVQLWFDGVKDLLDDGKLNASVDDCKSGEPYTELDDGTYRNYAENPLPDTDAEDPEEKEAE